MDDYEEEIIESVFSGSGESSESSESEDDDTTLSSNCTTHTSSLIKLLFF